MLKKQKGKGTVTETTGFWILVIVALILVLVGLVIFWVKILVSEGYYNYEGKGGEYEIGKSKVGNVIFYHISVFVDGKEHIFSFRNHPEDLEDLYLEDDLYRKLNRPRGIDVLYVTADPELRNMTNGRSVIATVAFEQVLGLGDANIYNVNVVNGFTSYVDENTPVVNCGNVSERIAVIYMKLGDESRVYSENDCVVVQGRGPDGMIRAGEKFAYYLLGVF